MTNVGCIKEANQQENQILDGMKENEEIIKESWEGNSGEPWKVLGSTEIVNQWTRDEDSLHDISL